MPWTQALSGKGIGVFICILFPLSLGKIEKDTRPFHDSTGCPLMVPIVQKNKISADKAGVSELSYCMQDFC